MTQSQSDSTEALLPLERAHEQLGITYKNLADIIGADESTVHRWRRGSFSPSPVFRRQLDMLDDCVQRAGSVFDSWRRARAWVHTENEAFGDDRPLDVLRRGGFQQVMSELATVDNAARHNHES